MKLAWPSRAFGTIRKMFEPLQDGQLTLGILVAVPDLDGVLLAVEERLRAPRDVDEERVGDVHYDHADGATAAGAQLAGGLVRHPPQLGDRVLHSCPGSVRHTVGRIQHI